MRKKKHSQKIKNILKNVDKYFLKCYNYNVIERLVDKMKKRIVFKKWLNNLLIGIATISFILVATTIDSEWTTEYIHFIGINGILFITSSLLLAKWGRPIEED